MKTRFDWDDDDVYPGEGFDDEEALGIFGSDRRLPGEPDLGAPEAEVFFALRRRYARVICCNLVYTVQLSHWDWIRASLGRRLGIGRDCPMCHRSIEVVLRAPLARALLVRRAWDRVSSALRGFPRAVLSLGGARTLLLSAAAGYCATFLVHDLAAHLAVPLSPAGGAAAGVLLALVWFLAPWALLLGLGGALGATAALLVHHPAASAAEVIRGAAVGALGALLILLFSRHRARQQADREAALDALARRYGDD